MSQRGLFDEERVYRVGEINRAVRLRVEQGFGDVWIEGELSDVKRSGPGHVYFTLNDELDGAQLRGVIFRSDAARAKARLANGERVRLRGTCTLYEPRGQFQMIARLALPQGEGDLAARFEALRRKLEEEGLLDPARKRPLPRYPRTVGVVTSLTGAAVRDIIRVAHDRMPVRLVVADCRVQGDDAPPSIVAALELIQRLPELDVVIVGRGGGAAEDLWAFNDERVARAIAACRVPIVSAVGHEIDVTLADLVADVRAATPSNAAEIVVPEKTAILERLRAAERHLVRAMEVEIGRERLRIQRLLRALEDPRHKHARVRRTFHEHEARVIAAMRRTLAEERRGLDALRHRLQGHLRAPTAEARAELESLEHRLRVVIRARSERARARLETSMAKLDALSPLRVLDRGYAIAFKQPEGVALRSVADAKPGDAIAIRLRDGTLEAKVEGESR